MSQTLKIPRKVLVFGTFDGIHPGHVYFLKSAAKHGELVISLASDTAVRAHKGKVPKKEKIRIKDLEELSIASKIVVGDKKIGNWSAIKNERPDIVAVGYDQTKLFEALEKIQKEYGFKIIKIKSFMPKKFHSSIIKKNFIMQFLNYNI